MWVSPGDIASSLQSSLSLAELRGQPRSPNMSAPENELETASPFMLQPQKSHNVWKIELATDSNSKPDSWVLFQEILISASQSKTGRPLWGSPECTYFLKNIYSFIYLTVSGLSCSTQGSFMFVATIGIFTCLSRVGTWPPAVEVFEPHGHRGSLPASRLKCTSQFTVVLSPEWKL